MDNKFTNSLYCIAYGIIILALILGIGTSQDKGAYEIKGLKCQLK